MISCGARLAPFDIKELRDLMAYDEMELDTIGDRKTALFLIMSDTDSTFIRAQLKADRAQSGKPQQREKEQEAKRSIRQALEME